MTQPRQKIVQYLTEAQAMEDGLVRVLQSQIAMAPRGSYRSALETHLRETQDHSRRLKARLRELDAGENPVQVVAGAAQSVVGQALALAKTPFDLVRARAVRRRAQEREGCRSSEAWRSRRTRRSNPRAEPGRRDDREARGLDSADRRERWTGSSPNPQAYGCRRRAGDQGRAVYYLSVPVPRRRPQVAEVRRDRAEDCHPSEAHHAPARKVPGVTEAEAPSRVRWPRGDLPIPTTTAHRRREIVEKLPQLSQIDLAKVEAYGASTPAHDDPQPPAAMRGDERGRATTSDRRRDRQAGARPDEELARASVPTSAPKSARACSGPPSASSPTPDRHDPGPEARRLRTDLTSCARPRRVARGGRRRPSGAIGRRETAELAAGCTGSRRVCCVPAVPRLPVAGSELHYERRGVGEPLLSSGHGGNVRHWGEPFLRELERDFELILYDHRGVGRSGPLPDHASTGILPRTRSCCSTSSSSSARTCSASRWAEWSPGVGARVPGRLATLTLGGPTAGGTQSRPTSQEVVSALTHRPVGQPRARPAHRL